MTSIMLVSIEYQRMGQFFVFLMAPSIILLSDMEKRTNHFWLQLIPKLMQGPTEILIYRSRALKSRT